MVATLDLFQLFVVYTFGGFWPAVIGLAGIFFLIMLLGKVSMYSILNILFIFGLLMVLGYGNFLFIGIMVILLAFRFLMVMTNVFQGGES